MGSVSDNANIVNSCDGDAGKGKPSGNPAAFDPARASFSPVIVVCGHYGVGKTNFSINLACDLARAGRAVCLCDLDVVNPYFRSSDYAQVLEEHGVEVLAPLFAGTALDAPMLSGRIATEIERARNTPGRHLIIDAGGDDAGATALGSFSDSVASGAYDMLYVVNALREQTTDAHAAAALLPEIEAQAHINATALVNNTHLMGETLPSHIKTGVAFANEVAEVLNLPVLCTTVPVRLAGGVDLDAIACDSVYICKQHVVTPWDA